jgi:hypothetical protein
MFEANTSLDYAMLLLMSIGRKSFSALGRVINRSGKAIAKMLLPWKLYVQYMQHLAVETFKHDYKLFIMIDETLLNKMYSKLMCGTGYFYDTKLRTSYKAYKMIIATVSNGEYTLPLECDFLFDQKLCSTSVPTRNDFVLHIIKSMKKLFVGKRLIFLLDGAFATEEYLKYAHENKIETEVRMPSNRVVEYRGKRVAVRDIKALRPKGKQMARVIRVMWHDLPLYITAARRVDKHGNFSVVFQAATYHARASEHVKHYKVRWKIEKKIRTGKLSCRLQDCYSTDLQIQLNHVHAALLAFAIAQLECTRNKLRNPEAAIRSIKQQNWHLLKSNLCRRYQLHSAAIA